jgi:Histone methylation protein DOT1
MEAAIDAMLTSPCAAEEIGGSNTSATPLFSDYTNPNAVENCLSPYVPTKADRIAALVRFARLKPEDVLLDLGSGDGRVCVAASMLTRCRSIGVELSPPCVRMARQLVADEGGDIDCEFIECDATSSPQDLLAGTWEAGAQLRYPGIVRGPVTQGTSHCHPRWCSSTQPSGRDLYCPVYVPHAPSGVGAPNRSPFESIQSAPNHYPELSPRRGDCDLC